ncbi:YgcG family protein [Aurantimonas sp. VKM B-3413]|uniref:TPM domain-containing protein n=1 Tax=Aurantimonas sp. VKM B-3413 TaxID=2779401 RepID=UPI001E5B9709|nr:YgcG family protein [Aurantimonas sp. VKM B-3413]MCB8840674.1 YgcG family protein [Aurantimonas sp. VKM B-3413]
MTVTASPLTERAPVRPRSPQGAFPRFAAIAARCGAVFRGLAPALFVVILLGSPSAAQTFPPLTGRVVDTADLLDPATEAAMTEKLAAFEQKSSDQIVVATIPSLEGNTIEDYGYRLGRAWGIGQEGENNGVVLLVARDDHKVRIEVGYGLEGTLTDALSSVIIQTDILPAFRSGDYAAGISKGVDGILTVLSGNAAELEARAERNKGWSGDDVATGLFVLVFFGIWALVIAMFVLSRLARRRGKKVGPNRYRWLGMVWTLGNTSSASGFSRSSGSSFGGGSSSGGFSGGGGSFGGGGSSGSW